MEPGGYQFGDELANGPAVIHTDCCLCHAHDPLGLATVKQDSHIMEFTEMIFWLGMRSKRPGYWW